MTETELAKRKCEACAPGTPHLEEAAAAELHAKVDPAWERDATRTLRRSFEFANFRDAFGFATRVALLAEGQGHHPDMEVGWGRVAVALTTHAADGLTDNDFIMAARIDHLG
jgi:4a-hydroxytetrahydrobiopterin dehydratase